MLIFDFDGILLDSVNEVAVTAFNTVTGSLAMRLEEVPPECIASYLANRYHYRSANDIPALMRWCIEVGASDPQRVLTTAEFRAVIAADPLTPAERLSRFFAARQQFLANDKTAWLALNGIFEPLWSALRRAGGKRVVIVTNKNRAAVVEATHHFGLEVVPENVYSGDTGVSKAENFRELDERWNAGRYLFVDDSVENLKKLKADCVHERFRIEFALGCWGYLGPGDREEAAREGMRLVEQTDIIELLEEELSR